MNLLLNLLFVIIAAGFAVLFLVSLIINIVRAVNVNKLIKKDPQFVEGKVSEIIKSKNRVFVKVDFQSKENLMKFTDVFELTHKEFNDQYYEGQDVKIFYAAQKDETKVKSFPRYLEGQKMGLEAGPIVTDLIMFIGGIYVFITALISELMVDPSSNLRGLEWNGRPLVSGLDLNTVTTEATGVFSIIYILIIFVLYFLFFNYVFERLRGMSGEHTQNYLKLCGVKGTAQVKTFKFSRSKNAQGMKEALLTIEFYTNKGEKVNTSISSYLYSETQEEFIDILYDEKAPKTAVYMRK